MTPATLQRAFEPFFTTKGPGQGHRPRPVDGLRLRQAERRLHPRRERGRRRAPGSRFTCRGSESPGARAGRASRPGRRACGPRARGRGRSAGSRRRRPASWPTRATAVAEAPDGEAALERLAHTQEPFDLVITDLAMPRMDGRELAERAAGCGPACRCCSCPVTRTRPRGGRWSSPTRPYLQKPFTAEELIGRLEEVLGRVR